MRNVLVTGAGGIGQACIKRFVENGDHVIIVDCFSKNVDLCKDKYPNVTGYVFDLSETSKINELVEKILEDNEKIDVLVQTAGIMASDDALNIKPEKFKQIMNVNVESLFFMMQQVVKQYMIDHGGVILNFASEAAIRGFTGPMAGVHYSASKGAVISMSKQLAVEWGHAHIRVNTICPGGVLTPAMEKMGFDEDLSAVPLQCLSRPEDIAGTVVYLCSSQAKMITGQNIVVDGGCAAVGC